MNAVGAREQTWRRFLAELDSWIAEHGDAVVPQAAESAAQGEPYALGARVKAYRAARRRGTLPAERVKAMESRPGWTWDGYTARASKAWEQHLNAVQQHVTAHGSIDGLEAADPPTARWLRQQRTATLTPAQQRALQRIPGALQDRKGRFGEFLTALRGWVAAEPSRDAGALRFTSVYRVGRSEYPLGKRAAYWRARYAQGRMSDAEVSALAAIPGWVWEPPRRSSGEQSSE